MSSPLSAATGKNRLEFEVTRVGRRFTGDLIEGEDIYTAEPPRVR